MSAGGSFLVKDIGIFKGFCQIQFAAVTIVYKDFLRINQRIFSLDLTEVSARAVFFGIFSFCDLPADIIGDLAPAFRVCGAGLAVSGHGIIADLIAPNPAVRLDKAPVRADLPHFVGHLSTPLDFGRADYAVHTVFGGMRVTSAFRHRKRHRIFPRLIPESVGVSVGVQRDAVDFLAVL